eukprot:scaffold1958_cov198-Alexandrium_tamarense.AAC.5
MARRPPRPSATTLSTGVHCMALVWHKSEDCDLGKKRAVKQNHVSYSAAVNSSSTETGVVSICDVTHLSTRACSEVVHIRDGTPERIGQPGTKISNTVITTTSDKENITLSPTQQPTNLSNDNDLADFLKGICWDDDMFEDTWQLEQLLWMHRSQYGNVVKMMFCCIGLRNKLRNDKSVVQAFQCIQESESIHPLLCGFVNNDDEWEYFIDVLKMIHRADGKYKC